MITSWSFSTLLFYEQCAYRMKLKYVDKIPEPPPDPDGPAARGTKVHDVQERWFKGGMEAAVPEDVRAFEHDLLEIRDRGWTLHVEEKWGFDENWEPVEWKDAWLRVKLDIGHFLDDGCTYRIIDLKTGKKEGNEIKHAMQGQLYACSAAAKFEDRDRFDVEFWYADRGRKLVLKPITREQTYRFRESWTRRANKMLEDTTFRPAPNKGSCRVCPYKEACDYAVVNS